jgi:hypothetical protein
MENRQLQLKWLTHLNRMVKQTPKTCFSAQNEGIMRDHLKQADVAGARLSLTPDGEKGNNFV